MSLQHQRETEPGGLVYPVQSAVAETLASITAFQDLVRSSLNDPHDFTQLPGTDRFTLLKPGAEKIVKLVACADLYEVVEQIADWDRPLFAYVVKCRLVSMRDSTVIWSEGLGECNTHEPKYRYRYAKRSCPECHYEPVLKSKDRPEWFCWQSRGGCGATYPLDDPAIVDQKLGRIPNPDPAELRNTMLKMAKKRALVDAAYRWRRCRTCSPRTWRTVSPTKAGPRHPSRPRPAAMGQPGHRRGQQRSKRPPMRSRSRTPGISWGTSTRDGRATRRPTY